MVITWPIGSEADFKGIVDIVKMKALIWQDEQLGAKFDEVEIPAEYKDKAAELRAALVEAEGNCERLARESEMRVDQLGRIAHDHTSWSSRLSDADGQIVELDARRELARISDPLSPNLEISAVVDEASKMPDGGPGLLFEQPTGYDMPVAANLFGSDKRMSLALGVIGADLPLQTSIHLVKRERINQYAGKFQHAVARRQGQLATAMRCRVLSIPSRSTASAFPSSRSPAGPRG